MLMLDLCQAVFILVMFRQRQQVDVAQENRQEICLRVADHGITNKDNEETIVL